jgi:hypothetical protein
MNMIAFQILTALVAANGTAAPANSLLTELVTKGVTMPDALAVKLPEPLMAEGLTAAQQAEVLKEIATQDKALRGNVKLLMDRSSSAPVSLRLAKMPSKQGNDLIRTVNVCFIVYGDWDVLTGKAFGNNILKKDNAKDKNKDTGGTAVSKAGYLKPAEIAVRRLSAQSTADLKEYYLYTTFKLFGQVEVSATRFGSATKTPTGVVVAAKVDPRFADDKQYPNQWRSIVRNAAGDPVLGPPQAYPRAGAKGVSGAGFYAKVTRLIEPADAIFVEYHSAFYEPEGWFGAENAALLPAELRKIIPYQVKQFRIKLATATKKAAEEKAASGEKKSTEAPDEK